MSHLFNKWVMFLPRRWVTRATSLPDPCQSSLKEEDWSIGLLLILYNVYNINIVNIFYILKDSNDEHYKSSGPKLNSSMRNPWFRYPAKEWTSTMIEKLHYYIRTPPFYKSPAVESGRWRHHYDHAFPPFCRTIICQISLWSWLIMHISRREQARNDSPEELHQAPRKSEKSNKMNNCGIWCMVKYINAEIFHFITFILLLR